MHARSTDNINAPGAPNCADICISGGLDKTTCGAMRWNLSMLEYSHRDGVRISMCECSR